MFLKIKSLCVAEILSMVMNPNSFADVSINYWGMCYRAGWRVNAIDTSDPDWWKVSSY